MIFNDKEYGLVSDYIGRHFGIVLGDDKKSLLASRLQGIFLKRGISSLSEYYSLLVSDRAGEVSSELADAIATNHTFFWREYDHFTFFTQKALPALRQRLRKLSENDIRIWCAACSTGEEAYTLAMMMMEFFGSDYRLYNAGILATDISEKALATARAGIYTEERLRLMPPAMKAKYFTRTADGLWQVCDTVKKEVTFRRHNLMNREFNFRKNFHMIFCRNVMIYFSEQTRWELVGRFHGVLDHEGHFFVGHSETLGREQKLFDYVQPAVYRKKAGSLNL